MGMEVTAVSSLGGSSHWRSFQVKIESTVAFSVGDRWTRDRSEVFRQAGSRRPDSEADRPM